MRNKLAGGAKSAHKSANHGQSNYDDELLPREKELDRVTQDQLLLHHHGVPDHHPYHNSCRGTRQHQYHRLVEKKYSYSHFCDADTAKDSDLLRLLEEVRGHVCR